MEHIYGNICAIYEKLFGRGWDVESELFLLFFAINFHVPFAFLRNLMFGVDLHFSFAFFALDLQHVLERHFLQI